MNRVIIGALVVLILLIFLTVLFTNAITNRNAQQQVQITPVPTQFFERPSGATGFSQKELQDKALVEQQGKVFSEEQLDRVNKFEERLPFSSTDFEIASSEATGEYFVQVKTPQGEEKLDEFLGENNVTDIKEDFDYLFNESKASIDQQLLKAEDDLVKARLKQILESQKPTPAGGSIQKKPEDYLADSAKTIMSFNFGTLKESAPAGKGGTGLIANPSVLDQIFNEAGSKVGTPPKMLKAIMSIECGRLISITPVKDILAWSAPGASGLPPSHFCYRNRSGYPAFGPMQFVVGTFARYGPAVNRYGGYTHRPSIQNIRDSVYAAAEHFKLNSGATGANWTSEQIKRAYVCYAAGCRQYDAGRIGKDTQKLYEMFLANYNRF